MGLEVGTYVNDLVTSNPIGASDAKGQGDDHLRLIKAVLKNTFPGAIGAYTFQSTDPGALEGPTWILDRFSASPAAADLIGGVIFRGRDSAAATIDYCNIVGRITDPNAGTTDSQIGLQIRVAGALTEILTIDGAGIAGVGTGLTALNASNLASGTIPNGRLTGSYTGITGTGALDAGSITSNFGAINVGADPISGGAISGTTGTFSGALSATTGTFSGAVGVTGNVTASGSVQSTGNVFGNGSAGTLNFRPNGIGSATAQMTYSSAGNLVVAGDVTANSDAALKDNVKRLNLTRAVDAVLHIDPITFTRKESGENSIGFIAQEVEQILPELVRMDNNGIRSLAYPNLTAVLWEVVKYLLQDKLASTPV